MEFYSKQLISMPPQSDYYDLLGISKSATPEEIKKAYRAKALEWHPDRNKAPEAESKFKEINQAYEILSDPQKKSSYDQFGHAAFSPGGGFGNPFTSGGQTGRSGPFTYTYTSDFGSFGGADFTDPFEIFEQFFGSGSPFGRAQNRPHYSIRVPFLDAIKGTEKKVVIQGQERTIKIPPGANDGTRIRFNEFDVSIDVETHPLYKREGDDIYLDHHINLSDAILGGTTEIPAISGPIKIKVRPGTQSHSMVRLADQGSPRLSRAGKGDLYVRIIVDIPEKLSKQQKKAIEDFQKAKA